jgi:hypothetical protein
VRLVRSSRRQSSLYRTAYPRPSNPDFRSSGHRRDAARLLPSLFRRRHNLMDRASGYGRVLSREPVRKGGSLDESYFECGDRPNRPRVSLSCSKVFQMTVSAAPLPRDKIQASSATHFCDGLAIRLISSVFRPSFCASRLQA